MAKRKPVYGGYTIADWVDAPVFNELQIATINEICSDALFADGVYRIAAHYVTVTKLNNKLTSAADDLVTVDDLEEKVNTLCSNLDNLPARVDAHLYKFNDQMDDLKNSLRLLAICIAAAKKVMPKPKTKSSSAGPKHEVARMMKSLFDEFGLKFIHTPPISKTSLSGPWAAGVCMKLVINRDKIELGDQAISSYIKSAKYPVTLKSGRIETGKM
jgi:hypothetical protein